MNTSARAHLLTLSLLKVRIYQQCSCLHAQLPISNDLSQMPWNMWEKWVKNLTTIDHTYNFEVQSYHIFIFHSFTTYVMPYNCRPVLSGKFMNAMSPYCCYSENFLFGSLCTITISQACKWKYIFMIINSIKMTAVETNLEKKTTNHMLLLHQKSCNHGYHRTWVMYFKLG